MEIDIINGDAFEIEADVLVLKYSQALHGLDRRTVERLVAAGCHVQELPKPGQYHLCDTLGQLDTPKVFFVGVVQLQSFGYAAIRDFARRALSALKDFLPKASHVALTLHGPNYGLDELEAFRSELAGLYDALEDGEFPEHLERITFVEVNAGRASRLKAQLSTLQSSGHKSAANLKTGSTPVSQLESLSTAGAPSEAKPHVFVAMPFAPEFDDRFHYGIQGAVNSAGYLCERADLSTFTGDVIAWVKERIDTAKLLVADLSTANANVYLEVGYAWGKKIPTVLVVDDAKLLRFDVAGQRCLVYNNSIKKLEELLTHELKGLQ
jgi:hypothetical protein